MYIMNNVKLKKLVSGSIVYVGYTDLVLWSETTYLNGFYCVVYLIAIS